LKRRLQDKRDIPARGPLKMGKAGNQDIRGTVDRGVNGLGQFLKRDIH
jgi:hypothetical protein